MDEKWENVEEGYKLLQVKGVPRRKQYLHGIQHLTEGEVTPRQKLRETRKEVVYLMGYASGLGFRSAMWSQRSLV